ncbi:MAG: glutathione peroxidase [Sphingomonas sp.]|nr:glutathione peroxidase [Sphingomonas sp.]|tara:strand:+ start:922 stop:1182 length:261 start_codon:yes stop_codon:yes gene_type:complete
MSDTPPDRLSINPKSPYFDQQVLQRGVGIRFKDAERRDVEEYCISEGWIRVALGKKVDRRGQPLTIKLSGPVEAWYESGGEEAEAE